MRAVFGVLSGKCGKSGVDSLVWDFHCIQMRGVGVGVVGGNTDITGFLDSATME